MGASKNKNNQQYFTHSAQKLNGNKCNYTLAYTDRSTV